MRVALIVAIATLSLGVTTKAFNEDNGGVTGVNVPRLRSGASYPYHDARIPSFVPLGEHPLSHLMKNVHGHLFDYLEGARWHVSHSQITTETEESSSLTISKGVSFERWIYTDEFSNASLTFEGDHCQKSDQFGDTECHFLWGETVTGRVFSNEQVTVDEGDSLSYKIEAYAYGVDKLLDWTFSCPACGTTCTIKFPKDYPINNKTEVTVEMPSCPTVIPAVVDMAFNQTLPMDSASGGVPVSSWEYYHLKNTKGRDRLKVETKILMK